MKKSILSFFFLLSLTLCHAANEIDTAYLRVNYHSVCRIRMEKPHETNEVVLEIGNRVSVFYEPRFRRFITLNDSLKANHASVGEYIRTMEQQNLMKYTLTLAVYKHYPHKDSLTYTDEIARYNYYYEQPLPALNWQMMEGDTIICGYQCLQAKAEWRGRTWRAWYAIDIPIDDGPWKLQGLPGLILYAEDAKGDFAFTCTSIEKKEKPITLWGKHLQKCTPQWLQREKIAYWKDQSGYINQRMGLPPTDYSGTGFIPYTFTYCPMENYE